MGISAYEEEGVKRCECLSTAIAQWLRWLRCTHGKNRQKQGILGPELDPSLHHINLTPALHNISPQAEGDAFLEDN